MPATPAFSLWDSSDKQVHGSPTAFGALQSLPLRASEISDDLPPLSARMIAGSSSNVTNPSQAFLNPMKSSYFRMPMDNEQNAAQQATQPDDALRQPTAWHPFKMSYLPVPSFIRASGTQMPQRTGPFGETQPLNGRVPDRFDASSFHSGEPFGGSGINSGGSAQGALPPMASSPQLRSGPYKAVPQQGAQLLSNQFGSKLQSTSNNGNALTGKSNFEKTRAGFSGLPHLDQSITVGPHQQEQVDSLHSGITSMADEFEGSKSYLESNRTKMAPGRNKCNEFVGDMIQAGGFPRPQVSYSDFKGKLGLQRDPSAKEWATVPISGYSNPLPLSEARPGDIIAMAHHDDPDGHVGIYMGNGMVASVNATTVPAGIVTINNWGFRGLGNNNEHKGDNPPVVRRWIGSRH